MKNLLPIGILSLALAVPAAAFAQDTTAPPVAQTGAAPYGQHETRQQSTTHGADTSGYGTEPGATSESKWPHASRHYAPLSNWGRNGLFAHH
jgi:hypothetical protein